MSRTGCIAALAAGLTLLQACGGGQGNVSNNPVPTLVAIKINPSNSLIPLAAQRPLQAIGVYSDGNEADITPTVTWSVSSAPSPTNFVSLDAYGTATSLALGTSFVSASFGSVQGVTPLTVNTNGYSSSTIGILTILLNKTLVDVGYLPQSHTLTHGVYTVQAINLDADGFSRFLPVPNAQISTVLMPAGFVPNVTVASQNSQRVAVISYTSPNIQVIDATNTVITTFVSPITQSVTLNGINCMICSAVSNPANDQVLLNTAQGFYSMDLTAGTFAPVTFAPAAVWSESFLLDPIAADPFVLAPTFGQPQHPAGEVQFLDLSTGAATSYTSWGVSQPNGAALDVFTSYGVVSDASANDEAFVNFADPQNPAPTLVSNISVCAGVPAPPPAGLNMVALGIGVGASTTVTPHTVFMSQPSGNCVGFETWPNDPTIPLDPSQIFYAYGNLPPTPDANPFINGSDTNAIATFTSVFDKKNYGVLVDANQNWIAKLNLGTLAGYGAQSFSTLPSGQDISPLIIAGQGGDPVVYLPAAGVLSLFPTSINFGDLDINTVTPPPPVAVTVTNESTATLLNMHIGIQSEGFNNFVLLKDFGQSSDCIINMKPQSQCTIYLKFTPTVVGPRSGALVVSFEGVSPQSVPLSGTGTQIVGEAARVSRGQRQLLARRSS